MWHGYLGIEDIALTAQQRQQLIDWFKGLGRPQIEQPAHFCHWRIRLDGKAAIFEALFEEANITIENVKARLAQIFGVDPATISHAVVQTQYGPTVTFNRSGEKLRMIQFGGSPGGCTWMTSGDAARAYVKANLAQWEAPA